MISQLYFCHGSTATIYLPHAILKIVACVLNQLTTKPTSGLLG